ncbi:NADH-quinone oxidoreductase subunit NuoN [Campylobacter corcagiensis]|uniref:NADH-quinone oxidoreductase subunit N n=1 Tax=Campylobacter corcagiensis TaxID=1448857 RepID=A0A7M1LH74_9BACT|nr:NADH-quinone oxidoreductase subunit NuoN [Campylobacter corcagiensis]QKF64008.1 NADH:quinone oxidoreductase I, membrane subunit N [Campylobacter corcagiensis]QOQ87790.1 NADH-quinone oxidoreductase subunit NuoN [Campylobacter corcagiensis]
MLNRLNMDFSMLNLASIAPMATCAVFGILILSVSMIKKDLEAKFYAVLALLGLIVNIGLMLGYGGAIRGLFDMVLIDGISYISNLLISIVSAVFVLYTIDDERFEEYKKAEFYSLFLFMVAGFGFMVSSDSLVLIIVALELSSISLYTLIALRNTKDALSAAIKYFVMGTVGSGFFIFGAAIFYLVTGSFEIDNIGRALISNNQGVTLTVGVVMIMVALGFKISAVPFHTWLGDVYSYSNSNLSAYISIVPKIAAFIVVLRLFNTLLVVDIKVVMVILFIISVTTMSIANIAALVQKDIKRMLAYSSISHAGFILVAVLVGSIQASMGMFLYWIMFCVANLGAFGVVLAYETKEADTINIEKLSSLISINPKLALAMSVFMFSLAGIPPFSVFWGKMILLSSAVSSSYYTLAVIMAINSAVAMYYYLRVIVVMLLSRYKSEAKFELNTILKWLIGICALLCILSPLLVKFIVPKIYALLLFSGF